MSDIKMVKLSIDGIDVEVPAGTNMVKAALKANKFIPHFCYHEGLSVAGQCRMCYVEIEGAPKLATACSTPIAEGMKIKTEATSPKVKESQKNTLEFTLLNHPLDCPICDRGGECKLQDFTLDYGPSRSRMDDAKRVSKKHTAVSEQIVLDQERCIVCTRCVRFSSEADGRAELVVNGRGSDNKIDVFENRPMQSPFSGNVVDICPVGALTAQDFRFKARPWELKSHDAICTGCSMGCNVTINTKHRHPGIPRPDKKGPNPEIERLMPRENMDINTYWMCDKGRWGYHFNNQDDKRLLKPLLNKNSVTLADAQKAMESSNQWTFLIDDSAPHELIDWAEGLKNSWSQRGRQVSAVNSSTLGDAFLKIWNERKSKAWQASPANWKSIKTVVSTLTYREIENLVPVLSLKLGQAVRQGKIQWQQRSLKDLHNSADSMDSVAYLVTPPKSLEDLKALQNLPADAKFLVLWSGVNARGLLDRGFAPMELVAVDLATQTPKGAIFLATQSTQNTKASGLIQFAKKSSELVMTDSFKNELTEAAKIVLPLNPLYESNCTFTSVEGFKQNSPGVHIHHPNVPAIERGGAAISASLKTL